MVTSKFLEVLKSELIAHVEDMIDNLNSFKEDITNSQTIDSVEDVIERSKKSLSSFDQRVESSYERAEYLADN